MRGTGEGGKTLTNMIKLVRTHKENLLLYDQISKLDRWLAIQKYKYRK
jgi:hypothetical protein